MSRARALLPFLLLLSGFCGISYEILYTKLLGNLLGNQFAVNATVLLTFLVGIGLGTLHAHRLVHFLWAVEGGIGLYAFAVIAGHGRVEEILYSLVPAVGTDLYSTAAVAALLLGPPAFLIGCSVPIFAAYLASQRETRVFALTYGIYNVGAALTALALEFALIRSLGLRATTGLLASANLAIAAVVFWLTRSEGLRPVVPAERRQHAPRTLLALALASVASAVFQLTMIKLTEFVLGPYNETFSLVLATVLLGLALGSAATQRYELSFRGALLVCLAGLAFTLAAFEDVARVYAWLYPAVAGSYPALVALKLGFVLLLMGVPAVGFGATIPALLASYGDVARESGQLLCWSSLANALGFLLMAFVLHRALDYGALLLVIAATTALAVAVQAGWRHRSTWAAVGIAALSALFYRGAWDEGLLFVGHTNFRSLPQLAGTRVAGATSERFKGSEDVFAIVWREGIPYFFINGYVSVPLRTGTEKIVGALASMLAPRTDDALVLGVGSGATASVVGLVFDRTDAIEINRVVLENLHRMREYNFDIERMAGVSIVHDDGIHFLRVGTRRYSLILNTVTTPLYFSSSKLYTRDFFDLVKRRLAPDGVYVTWMDRRVGDRGVDIILATLAERFERCWLSYLTISYFLLTCSDAPLELRQFEAVTRHERLRRHFAQEYSLPIRLLPYSVLSTDATGLGSAAAAALNTLDLPVLEFEMARLRHDATLERFTRRLLRAIDPRELQRALGRSMDWQPVEFRLHADLLGRDRQSLPLSGGALRGVAAGRYDAAALGLARELGSAQAFAEIAALLAARGRHVAAVEALEQALRIAPGRIELHERLGDSLAAAGDPERALPHYLRSWEHDRGEATPREIGGVLRALGRDAEAREWLDTAAALEAWSQQP